VDIVNINTYKQYATSFSVFIRLALGFDRSDDKWVKSMRKKFVRDDRSFERNKRRILEPFKNVSPFHG
jgi:hypothetical protein